jgi:hypothetical protein
MGAPKGAWEVDSLAGRLSRASHKQAYGTMEEAAAEILPLAMSLSQNS